VLNPPPAQIGTVNAFVGGLSRRYEVAGFSAPLSIKSVIRGTATWATAAGDFEMGPSGCLVINDGEAYSMVVDALQPVETFCVFFSRGFVEGAMRSATTSSAALLDSTATTRVEFAARMQFDDELRRLMEVASDEKADESITLIANRLVALHTDIDSRVSRLPALRAATRAELHRRVNRGIELIHGNLDGDLSLERLASAACLAPFHFHRIFTALHGETPHRYVTRLRLLRAATLLRSTDRPVLDIALSCGFESLGSFTTLFRRHLGAAPAAFRKKRETPAGEPVQYFVS
jgi:AraC family transcriptional regulator